MRSNVNEPPPKAHLGYRLQATAVLKLTRQLQLCYCCCCCYCYFLFLTPYSIIIIIIIITHVLIIVKLPRTCCMGTLRSSSGAFISYADIYTSTAVPEKCLDKDNDK